MEPERLFFTISYKVQKSLNQRLVVEGVGEVSIKRRRAQKNTSLRISKSGDIVVGTNFSTPLHSIRKFVLQNKDWLNEVKTKNGIHEQIEIFDEQILCPGVKFKLEWAETPAGILEFKYRKGSGVIRIIADQILEDSISLSSEDRKKLEKYVIRAVREKAKEYLPKRLGQISEMMGVEYLDCTVRDSSTRWGSCSSKNSINLSLWLMLVPAELIDYVLVHELVHVKFKHHQTNFWDEVARFQPDYKELRAKLKKYSSQVWW